MKTLLEPTRENIEQLKPGTTYFVVLANRLSQVRAMIYDVLRDYELHTAYDAQSRVLRVSVTTIRKNDSRS
jgi:hypothetical protein